MNFPGCCILSSRPPSNHQRGHQGREAAEEDGPRYRYDPAESIKKPHTLLASDSPARLAGFHLSKKFVPASAASFSGAHVSVEPTTCDAPGCTSSNSSLCCLSKWLTSRTSREEKERDKQAPSNQHKCLTLSHMILARKAITMTRPESPPTRRDRRGSCATQQVKGRIATIIERLAPVWGHNVGIDVVSEPPGHQLPHQRSSPASDTPARRKNLSKKSPRQPPRNDQCRCVRGRDVEGEDGSYPQHCLRLCVDSFVAVQQYEGAQIVRVAAHGC